MKKQPTPREIAEPIALKWEHEADRSVLLRKAIERGLAAEREACMQLLLDCLSSWGEGETGQLLVELIREKRAND